MPQAVDAYVSGKSYEQIDFVKRKILSLYEEDLAKYDTENREKMCIRDRSRVLHKFLLLGNKSYRCGVYSLRAENRMEYFY